MSMRDNPSVFAQGLYEESSTRKHELGTMRMLSDGRCFVYCQNGGVALGPGLLSQSSVPVANHDELATNTGALGAKSVSITVGATAVTANQYDGGYIHVNKGTGLGYYYKIAGHDTADASAACTFYLEDAIRKVWATNEVTLVPSPHKGLVVCPTTLTSSPHGVPTDAVTISYYFWAQVKGPAAAIVDATTGLIGYSLVPSDATAGNFEVTDLNSVDAGGQRPIVANVIEIGITAETSLVHLQIPGF